jgi:hypothetical protein
VPGQHFVDERLVTNAAATRFLAKLLEYNRRRSPGQRRDRG